jgi:transposase
MLKEISVVEQRYQAVLAVREDGLSVTDVAAKVGVSRQTLHGWLNRYAEGGLAGLAELSHRPRSCPHQMAAEVEVRLVELRQLHPTWARIGCCIGWNVRAWTRCRRGRRSAAR